MIQVGQRPLARRNRVACAFCSGPLLPPASNARIACACVRYAWLCCSQERGRTWAERAPLLWHNLSVWFMGLAHQGKLQMAQQVGISPVPLAGGLLAWYLTIPHHEGSLQPNQKEAPPSGPF